MKPVFSMVSDSTQPEVTSCTGRWYLADYGKVLELRFENSKDCFRADRFINLIYEEGERNGRLDVKYMVQSALNNV